MQVPKAKGIKKPSHIITLRNADTDLYLPFMNSKNGQNRLKVKIDMLVHICGMV